MEPYGSDMTPGRVGKSYEGAASSLDTVTYPRGLHPTTVIGCRGRGTGAARNERCTSKRGWSVTHWCCKSAVMRRNRGRVLRTEAFDLAGRGRAQSAPSCKQDECAKSEGFFGATVVRVEFGRVDLREQRRDSWGDLQKWEEAEA